jgi:hypothetical protein
MWYQVSDFGSIFLNKILLNFIHSHLIHKKTNMIQDAECQSYQFEFWN